MGGIMMFVFGFIVVVGMSMFIKVKVDMGEVCNFVIVLVVMIFGIGGMFINVGEFLFKGISFCVIVVILMNLVLFRVKNIEV